MTTSKKEATPPAEDSTTANVTPLREVKRVADAADIESLWLDPKLGDEIVSSTFHAIAVGKPKDYFRTVPIWLTGGAARSTPTRSRV